MTTLAKVRAREVLDSRGFPTVEVELASTRLTARGLVPSGASTGSREALELRDGGSRWQGKGVKTAVANVEQLARKLIGHDIASQEDLDRLLIEQDPSPTKATLGANALLGISLAFCRLQALEKQLPLYTHIAALAGKTGHLLPVPQLNLLNGGKHAGFENDIQEHMIVPRAKTFAERLEQAGEMYQLLRTTLKKQYGPSATHLADEGGFAPTQLQDTRARLELLMQIRDELGYTMEFALDAAASEFYQGGSYHLGTRSFSAGELIDFYRDLVSTYPITSLEDGLAEGDWDGWTQLQQSLGSKLQIVGDDILVTNPILIQQAIDAKACNALLLKVNQIGTVTEALKAAALAQSQSWGVVVSHRSGETEDAFIADLAVGIDAGQCKFGAPARSDRTAKYNQLLRIEEALTSEET